MRVEHTAISDIDTFLFLCVRTFSPTSQLVWPVLHLISLELPPHSFLELKHSLHSDLEMSRG